NRAIEQSLHDFENVADLMHREGIVIEGGIATAFGCPFEGVVPPEQVAQIAPSEGLQKVLRGGCYTAIISPEGVHLCEPIREGEGIAIAPLDFSLIVKRKRMMDSVGHYARPDLFQLRLNAVPYSVMSDAADPAVVPSVVPDRAEQSDSTESVSSSANAPAISPWPTPV
ncbi:MAG: hypothetical protein AAFR99_17605, partial [Cyanobacteria bacterium J06629_9]